MQKLGIIIQIDDKMSLYFMHLFVELLLLLSYYAKYSESVGCKNILQMGESRKKGRGPEKTKWGFLAQGGTQNLEGTMKSNKMKT